MSVIPFQSSIQFLTGTAAPLIVPAGAAWVANLDVDLLDGRHAADFVSFADLAGANRVLAGPPAGADAAPSFRSLVTADLPADALSVGAEVLTSKTFEGLPVYRKVVAVGSLPNATTKTIAHGAGVGRVVRILGWARRPIDALTIQMPNGA